MAGKKLRIVGNSEPLSANLDTPPRPLGRHGALLWSSITLSTRSTTRRGVRCFTTPALHLIGPRTALRRLQLTVLSSAPIPVSANIRRCAAELASRSFCVRTLARLGLDYEPVKAVGRPPSSYGFKGYE